MSLIHCSGCRRVIDTDDDPESIRTIETTPFYFTLCEQCRGEPDGCKYCGKGLYQEEVDEWLDACHECARREGLANQKETA